MTDSKRAPAGANSLLPMPLTGLVTLMCSHMIPVTRVIQNIIFKDLLQPVSIYFVALLSSIVASTGLLVNAVCCITTTVFYWQGI
jgi:hypothetical protein